MKKSSLLGTADRGAKVNLKREKISQGCLKALPFEVMSTLDF